MTDNQFFKLVLDQPVKQNHGIPPPGYPDEVLDIGTEKVDMSIGERGFLLVDRFDGAIIPPL